MLRNPGNVFFMLENFTFISEYVKNTHTSAVEKLNKLILREVGKYYRQCILELEV